VETLGITRLSKSQVSVMAKELDAQVESFRTRPLDAGPYTFIAADALVLKVREGGRVVNVHALLGTVVNADGHREILGLQVTSGEDGAGWLAFLRDLTARGLSGVRLVTSDAHAGLVAAIGATLPGASWQRCRTHYAATLMSATPKSSWPWVKTLLHSVYDQPDRDAVHDQYDRILDALSEKLPAVAEHLDTARADVLAFSTSCGAFPAPPRRPPDERRSRPDPPPVAAAPPASGDPACGRRCRAWPHCPNKQGRSSAAQPGVSTYLRTPQYSGEWPSSCALRIRPQASDRPDTCRSSHDGKASAVFATGAVRCVCLVLASPGAGRGPFRSDC